MPDDARHRCRRHAPAGCGAGLRATARSASSTSGSAGARSAIDPVSRRSGAVGGSLFPEAPGDGAGELPEPAPHAATKAAPLTSAPRSDRIPDRRSVTNYTEPRPPIGLQYDRDGVPEEGDHGSAPHGRRFAISSTVDLPNEAKLRRDIRHFERQIARLSSPNSTWEQGALKCYQVLVRERRRLLDEMRAGVLSSC